MLMVALVAVLHPQTAPTGFGLGALRCVGLDWVGWAGLGCASVPQARGQAACQGAGWWWCGVY